MFYRDWGPPDAPRTLVCVHGLTRSGRDFEPLAQALSGRIRVVCPDVVGRGLSDWLFDPRLYHAEQYADDCLRLLERLRLKNVDWLGTSMGGLIGMRICVRFSQNCPIRRLLLNDVGPQLEPQGLTRIASYLGHSFKFDSWSEAIAHHREVYAPFGALSDAQWESLARSVLVEGEDLKIRYAYDPRVVEGQAPATPNPWKEWEQMTLPVLLLRGQQSDILSAATAERMAKRADTTVEVIEGVGHAPPLLSDREIQLVRGFVERP